MLTARGSQTCSGHYPYKKKAGKAFPNETQEKTKSEVTLVAGWGREEKKVE